MSSRVPALTPRDVIRVLERRGFFVHRIAGSHHVLKHPRDPRIRVVVALHRREFHPGTVRGIIKDAGMTIMSLLPLPGTAEHEAANEADEIDGPSGVLDFPARRQRRFGGSRHKVDVFFPVESLR